MPAAVLIPSLISAGTSIVGGVLGSRASKSAGRVQSDAAAKVAADAKAAGDSAATGVKDAATTAGTSVTAAAGDAAKSVQTATGDAINTVQTGTAQANSSLADVLQLQLKNLSPYQALGERGATSLAEATGAGGALSEKFAFDPAKISENPNYQFTLAEGLKAVQRAAAARGSGLGGGTLKALTQYSQGLASNTINDAFTQALQTFQTNRDTSLAGIDRLLGVGQSSTNQANNALGNFGNQSASNTLASAVYGGDAARDAARFTAGLTTGAAEYTGNTGIRAAEYGGDANLRATQIAGDAITGGANARAAGTVGASNAWTGALSGIGNAAQMASILSTAGKGGFGTAAVTRPFSLPAPNVARVP